MAKIQIKSEKLTPFGGHFIAYTTSDYCLLTKSASDCFFEDSCGF